MSLILWRPKRYGLKQLKKDLEILADIPDWFVKVKLVEIRRDDEDF